MGLRKPEPAIYQRALDILGSAGRAFCLSTIAQKMWRAPQRTG